MYEVQDKRRKTLYMPSGNVCLLVRRNIPEGYLEILDFNRYTKRGTRTYNPKIKSRTAFRLSHLGTPPLPTF